MRQIDIIGKYFGDNCFPSLNDYLKELIVSPKLHGNTMKQRFENIVVMCARKSLGNKKIRIPAQMHYIFGESNGNRDYSNVVAFAVKTIEDGLQKCGLLINDNQKCVLPYTFEFRFVGKNEMPYIKIQINEGEKK